MFALFPFRVIISARKEVDTLEIEHLSVDALVKGYKEEHASQSFICLSCEQVFDKQEVYQVGEQFFMAERAVEKHVETMHPDYFSVLLNDQANYNKLTEKQQAVLTHMYQGASDKTMADALSVTPSTVRHQRFSLREKAKQAKHFLAVYEQARLSAQTTDTDTMVPIHKHATMVDERYHITEKERDQTLQTAFLSLDPLKLKHFPKKEKKKIVILAKIADYLDQGQVYTEIELNHQLAMIYDDIATVRRYLIEYGFMARTKDGSAYWVQK